MGGISAMNSIDRILETHGDEIKKELAQQVPDELSSLFRSVYLENATYGIKVYWEFDSGGLEGPLMDIDDLATRYPDCDVGY